MKRRYFIETWDNELCYLYIFRLTDDKKWVLAKFFMYEIETQASPEWSVDTLDGIELKEFIKIMDEYEYHEIDEKEAFLICL